MFCKCASLQTQLVIWTKSDFLRHNVLNKFPITSQHSFSTLPRQNKKYIKDTTEATEKYAQRQKPWPKIALNDSFIDDARMYNTSQMVFRPKENFVDHASRSTNESALQRSSSWKETPNQDFKQFKGQWESDQSSNSYKGRKGKTFAHRKKLRSLYELLPKERSYDQLAGEGWDNREEADTVAQLGDQHKPDVKLTTRDRRELIRRQKFFLTIKKKYFSDPEPNLLTYDAKEQIKYLNREFPEEWTPEKLSQSFPASEDSIRKLLRSPWKPVDVQELIAHDNEVIKTCKQLEDAGKGIGPLRNRFEEMRRQGKLASLAAIAGLPHLPRPQVALPSYRDNLPQTKGHYGMLIDRYMAHEKRALIAKYALTEEEQRELYRISQMTTMKAMESLLKLVPKKVLEKQTPTTFQQPTTKPKLLSSGKKVNYVSAFSPPETLEKMTAKEPQRMKDGPRTLLEAMEELESHDEGVGEEAADESFEVWKKTREVHLRKALQGEELSSEDVDNIEQHTDIDSEYQQVLFRTADEDAKRTTDIIQSKWILESPGMKGTEKISKGNETVTDIERDKPIKPLRIRRKVPDLYVDHPAPYSSDGVSEVYMYDEATGYQYPCGRYDRRFEKIRPKRDPNAEPVGQSTENRMFKKGQDYYDEDGEFLFRKP